jgi:4-hydroxybenzoate polyprenyltransferase
LLDGVVVLGSALVGGAEPMDAARLGASMTLLQASIGALNDLVDAPTDAGRKAGKPIPAGSVSVRVARAVVVVAAVAGVGLAVPSGIPTVVLALVVLAIGYGYDLVAKGTIWSWLPFAIGIPLLPVFGWIGAGAAFPGWFAILLPAAAVAGAALAIANTLADLERDAAAGTRTIATALGAHRAWLAGAVLWSVVGVVAVWSVMAGVLTARAGSLTLIGLGVGLAVIAAGTVLGRGGDPARRERAWQAQAVGAGIAGIAWVAAVAI